MKDLLPADLAADDDPAVLPGGVEGDLGRGEELVGLPRHGRRPTGALLFYLSCLLCPCPYGGMGEGGETERDIEEPRENLGASRTKLS